MTRSISKAFVVGFFSLALLLSSLLPAATPKAEAAIWPWSNRAAIFFNAGVHNGAKAYISSIYVCYQDGSGCFQSAYPKWTYNGVLVDGGRSTWELKRGVRIKFYLDGYGYRQCDVKTDRSFFTLSYATVTYLGNNQCSI